MPLNAISPTTLIQSTDQYLGTHNIPIVIQGPNQLDCAVSVLWLRRMGWDAWLRDRFRQEPVISERTSPANIGWEDAWLDADRIIDLRPSNAFKASRINGSNWMPRSQFPKISPVDECLFVCDYSQINHTRRLVNTLNLPNPICVDWDEIPQELIDTSTISFEAHPSDQALFFPDRHQGNLEHAKGYLDWEHSLLPTLKEYGDIPWRPINEPLDHPKSHLTKFYQKVHLWLNSQLNIWNMDRHRLSQKSRAEKQLIRCCRISPAEHSQTNPSLTISNNSCLQQPNRRPVNQTFNNTVL